MRNQSALLGFLIGVMTGDSIGLPYEGMSRARVRALIGNEPLRHRLLFGRGMVSDDTEHALMTLAAWRRSRGSADAFSHSLANHLRFWLLCVPPGCGFATAKACLKLLVGFPPSKSGVNSAGNGPAMRSGILGVICASDDELVAMVRASSHVTHTDPRAEHGALAIALAAKIATERLGHASNIDRFEKAIANLPDGEMKSALVATIASVRRSESSEQFATQLCGSDGVSGFIMHTIPVVVHLWLSEQTSFEHGVTRGVLLGGDTDTVAALLGGLLGCQWPEQIPTQWTSNVLDYPISLGYLTHVCANDSTSAVLRWRFAAQPLRNLFFLVVVLVHAGRRIFPPYR